MTQPCRNGDHFAADMRRAIAGAGVAATGYGAGVIKSTSADLITRFVAPPEAL